MQEYKKEVLIKERLSALWLEFAEIICFYVYAYDKYGNLASVTDSLGNKTTSVYDEVGNVIKETDVEES